MSDVQIGGGDGGGIEQARGFACWLLSPLALDAAVDDDMRHMDPLWVQLARHALREAAERKLAHRERRRLRVALDAGGGPGEHHAAVLLRQHALDRLLTHQEAAEGGGHQGLFDLRRIEFGDRPAGAIARIVDYDLRRTEVAVQVIEQLFHVGALAGVAGKGFGADLLGQTVEVGRRARND